MNRTINERLKLHEQFWHDEKVDRFPISFRFGDYFFATQFSAARDLLKPGMEIKPDMVHVDDFLSDYERMFQQAEQIGQDGFWVAEPFTAIPWMGAILGCPVFAGSGSFVTEPILKATEYSPPAQSAFGSAWIQKYMEFTEKLVSLSKGRFPVGQPILRGPSDMMGALMGQMRMIYEMNDAPEKMREMAGTVTRSYLDIVGKQFELIPAFHGGHAIGFYHLWTPGRCIWFQEDGSALLSPAWYNAFIRGMDEEICRNYDYTAIHLHPVSLHILDSLLRLDGLKAIEVNKDVGGPSIEEMLPVFRRILEAGKRLVLWGSLDEADLSILQKELPGRPIFLSIVIADADRAREIMRGGSARSF